MNATNASSLIAPEEPNLDCITPTSISAVTLPTPRLPDTNIQTIDGEPLGLMDMLSVLGSGIVIVPFVAILQSIGIGIPPVLLESFTTVARLKCVKMFLFFCSTLHDCL